MEVIKRLGPVATPSDRDTVDAYGRRGATIPKLAPVVSLPAESPPAVPVDVASVAGDVIRATAEKLISDSSATVQAAEGILKMLRDEAETFASEVRKHAANLAARMESYVKTCEHGTAALQTHRDEVMKVASIVADIPAAIESKTDDDTTKDRDE